MKYDIGEGFELSWSGLRSLAHDKDAPGLEEARTACCIGTVLCQYSHTPTLTTRNWDMLVSRSSDVG